MFDRLKRLYEKGKITEVGLQNAVANGWITYEEYAYIMGGNSGRNNNFSGCAR